MFEDALREALNSSKYKKDKEVVVKRSGGIGFFGALFLVFLTLKLTNVIAWSWWWVTSPLWLPIAIILGVGVVIILIALLIALAFGSRQE